MQRARDADHQGKDALSVIRKWALTTQRGDHLAANAQRATEIDAERRRLSSLLTQLQADMRDLVAKHTPAHPALAKLIGSRDVKDLPAYHRIESAIAEAEDELRSLKARSERQISDAPSVPRSLILASVNPSTYADVLAREAKNERPSDIAGAYKRSSVSGKGVGGAGTKKVYPMLEYGYLKKRLDLLKQIYVELRDDLAVLRQYQKDPRTSLQTFGEYQTQIDDTKRKLASVTRELQVYAPHKPLKSKGYSRVDKVSFG
jgi:hypothetical protein